jgi:integrase
VPTRTGRKKAQAVSLKLEQARQLKDQPDTPQGRRDALLMCLLLDHGLRCGEVAGLQVTDFNLTAGELHFYRPKVDKTQTHRLSRACLRAAKAYFAVDAPAIGSVLRASRKNGELNKSGMSEQAITERVRILGAQIGVVGLSAHDCRHYWATHAARGKTPLDRLQDAGGWSSPAMPMRYIEAAKIANIGVKLEGEEEE